VNEVVKYPFAADFQVQILALLLRDNSFLKKNVNIIDPSYFDNPLFAQFAKLAIEYCHQYDTVPSKAVIPELLVITAESPQALLYASIYELDLSDAEFIADRVVKFAKFQAVKRQLKLSEKLLANEQYDYIEKGLVEALHTGDMHHNSAHSFFDNVEGLIDGLSEENLARIIVPTCIREIDDALNGGARVGDLNIVMGVPGSGKSVFLTNAAHGALFYQKNVLYLSMEMSVADVEARLASRISGVEISKLVESKDEVLQKIRDRGIHMGEMRTQFWPAGTPTTSDIRTLIEHLIRVDGFKPDLVLVDYLELMRVPGNTDGDYVGQGIIGKELKGMAAEHSFALWIATQAKRGAMAKTHLKMDDKADSFKVMQDADVVLGLKRNEDNIALSTIDVSFAKLRHSGAPAFVQTLRGNYAKMYIGSNS